MGSHNLSHADTLAAGDAYHERYHVNDTLPKRGLPVNPPLYHSFGAPITADDDLLIVAATSTELPNAGTTTYTWATDGTSPLDNVATAAPATVTMADGLGYLVVALDVPRAITGFMTHGSAVVASTMIISGFDYLGVAMTELFTFTAGSTSKTVVGKKAFKYILSFAIASASDSTANTLGVGCNDILGLPYRVTTKDRVIPIGDGALDASATIVIGDDTTATNATGDTRGTIDFNTASNATRLFAVWMMPTDRQTKTGAFGVTPA